MGLIKAGLGAVGGVLADQWKEFFYCDSMSSEVLVTKGQKRTSSRSSNTRGSDNIITSGSGIAVADGQCMLIVEQGKVVELCAEPGEFTYDASTEPSIFNGKLSDGIKETFKLIGKRFTYGGDTAKDQRVYYINTKEIMGNKFGTATPIMFKVLIPEVSLTINTKIRCSGTYTYKITDPIRFYTRIAANVSSDYRREELDEQLKSEMIDALQPAFGELSALRLDPSEIPAHKNDLKIALNNALSYEWTERRGISVESIAVANLSIPEEDEKKIQDAQEAMFYSDPSRAAGMSARATATAMNTAAGNTNGAVNGFVGMGMATNAGSSAAANLFGIAQQQQQQAKAADAWRCSCGAEARGKFCAECGSPKPVASEWRCSCGALNSGNFCTNCGNKKPAVIRCENCGRTFENAQSAPKFCPECGNKF